MRVLFATNHAYLPQRVGGSESSTHDLVWQLRAMGHDAAVIAELLGGDRVWLRNRLKSRIAGVRFPLDRIPGYSVYRGYDVGDGMAEVIARYPPDAVIIQAGRPLRLAQILLDAGVKTFVYLRDVFFDKLGGEIPSGNLGFIANSAFTARRFKAFSGIDAVVLPPIVRREAYQTQGAGKHVLFVNPVEMKGREIAIALAARNPEISFLFVEGWPLDAVVLSELQSRLKPMRNVRFVRNQHDMCKVYAQARIALVPSQVEEAWGRIPTEAHFSGIPVLASAIGGLPESVGPGGMLVPPDAPIDVWDRHLKSLWCDEEHYQALSDAALAYSQRSEIQPEALCQALLDRLG